MSDCDIESILVQKALVSRCTLSASWYFPEGDGLQTGAATGLTGGTDDDVVLGGEVDDGGGEVEDEGEEVEVDDGGEEVDDGGRVEDAGEEVDDGV